MMSAIPVATASIEQLTQAWDMDANSPDLPVLSMNFGPEGSTRKPPNRMDIFMGPEEKDGGEMAMGLLPVFEVVAVKDSYKIPTRTEVAREMMVFMRDLAARNASNVVGKPLEDIWHAREKPAVRPEWTFMKWPEMVEQEFNIPRNNAQGKFYSNIIVPNTTQPTVYQNFQ